MSQQEQTTNAWGPAAPRHTEPDEQDGQASTEAKEERRNGHDPGSDQTDSGRQAETEPSNADGDHDAAEPETADEAPDEQPAPARRRLYTSNIPSTHQQAQEEPYATAEDARAAETDAGAKQDDATPEPQDAAANGAADNDRRDHVASEHSPTTPAGAAADDEEDEFAPPAAEPEPEGAVPENAEPQGAEPEDEEPQDEKPESLKRRNAPVDEYPSRNSDGGQDHDGPDEPYEAPAASHDTATHREPETAKAADDERRARNTDAQQVPKEVPAHDEQAARAQPQPPVPVQARAGNRLGAFARAVERLPLARRLFGGGTSRVGAASDVGPRPSNLYADKSGHPDPLPDLPDSHSTSELENTLVARPSEEAIEERLTLALRETMVEGFSRIAVGSPKGGVGKSSLAYAIAGAIAYYTNIRVCLVDADPEFGATRMMVPRPINASIVDMARDADELYRLSDIRNYIAQNERMRVDVVLNAPNMSDKAAMHDLPGAYRRIDTVLSRVYDIVIYDMGLGFSHPQIQTVLDLSEELLLIGDSEVVPNAMLNDALTYLEDLGTSLSNTTLCINHRLPATDESAATDAAKTAAGSRLRRITEVPYDAAFSQLLNRRAMHVEDLSLRTRLGVLTTAASCLEGIRKENNGAGPHKGG